jgi:hypothetical protein
LLPERAERIGKVSEFATHEGYDSNISYNLRDDEKIPGKIILENGRVLQDIDYVIVCTGYITTYPFLGALEQPSVDWGDADERVITTSDGYTHHNLYKDIFYIPDPTLTFIGVSHMVSTFSLFDFQAEVAARVFAGQVRLPSGEKMREEHRERKKKFQVGDRFHSLMAKEDKYMNEILAWVNRDLTSAGSEPMKGVDADWVVGYAKLKERLKTLRGQAISE